MTTEQLRNVKKSFSRRYSDSRVIGSFLRVVTLLPGNPRAAGFARHHLSLCGSDPRPNRSAASQQARYALVSSTRSRGASPLSPCVCLLASVSSYSGCHHTTPFTHHTMTDSSPVQQALPSEPAPVVVTKARTAFLYYQTQHLAAIRAELGGAASMGDAMTELARRWRLLEPHDRAVYDQLEADDRKRFERESAEADEAARLRLESKRAADNDTTTARAARQKIDQDRQAKEERRERRRQHAQENLTEEEREERRRIAEEKKRETEERRQKKQAETDKLQSVHKKLDKEEAKKASQRLEYLVKQSSIFAKLSGGKAGTSLVEATSPSRESSAAKDGNVHHVHSKDSNASEDEELLEGEEEAAEQRVVFLTQQPSIIKHGQLKGYQCK